MATSDTTKDNGRYPIDPWVYYDQAAPSYEDNSVSLKEIGRHVLGLGPTPLSRSSVVLDGACGPGVLTGELLTMLAPEAQPRVILATDFSPKMIEMLNRKKTNADQKASGWEKVDARVMDSQDLHVFVDGTFTHSYMNFSLFFIEHPVKAAMEIYRTLKLNGTAFVTTWAVLGYIPLLQHAQHAVRPDVEIWPGPVPQVWITSEKLEATLMEGGFHEERIEIRTHSTNLRFAEWTMEALMNFTASSRMMISKGWSEDQKKELDTEAEKVFAAATATAKEVEMKAWVAIATK